MRFCVSREPPPEGFSYLQFQDRASESDPCSSCCIFESRLEVVSLDIFFKLPDRLHQ